MMSQKPYVIWICSWYPNELQPYVGDFIQRHARAVSREIDLVVIHAVRDVDGTQTKQVRVEKQASEGLQEITIYYHVKPILPGIDAVRSLKIYNKWIGSQVEDLVTKRGLPLLFHDHVVWKAGLSTSTLARKYSLPWVITEHWTAYLPQADRNLNRLPLLQRMNMKRLLHHADGVMAVSDHLALAMSGFSGRNDIKVIPNVVDSSVFFPLEGYEPKDFIHVSGMTAQKHPELVLQSFALFCGNGGEGNLHMVGGMPSDLVRSCAVLGIDHRVRWYDEIPQSEINLLFQNCRALIFPSRYETFGCVVIEAFAAGLPVLGSKIPTLEFLIPLGEGRVVEGRDPAVWADAMTQIQPLTWAEREGLSAATTGRFGFGTVARQILEWYRTVTEG